METRGIRNCNPGNLRKNTVDKWQGLSAEQDDPSFFKFDNAVYGIRALARTLLAYQDRNKCTDIFDYIGRWAPPTENDTVSYRKACADYVGVLPTDALDLHQYKNLRALTEAIIQHENGARWKTWYTEAEMVKAMVLAGVEPEKRSLLASGQVIGGALTAAAVGAGPVVQTAQESLQPLTDYSSWIKGAFVCVALLGVLITVITKFNERKKGIS